MFLVTETPCWQTRVTKHHKYLKALEIAYPDTESTSLFLGEKKKIWVFQESRKFLPLRKGDVSRK